jgi:hypothetical protein
MSSVWDDPDLKPPADEFAKLENKGDRISGVITAIRSHRFSDTDVAPQLTFLDDTTGDEKIWTAGQLQAKRKLSELRPEAGDWFCAELTDIEKRGTKTLKHIHIEVKRAGKPAAAPTAAAPGPDINDVLSRLTAEQRAVLLTQQSTAASAPPF